MSSLTSGIGNRFGSLDVNINDPSEISKKRVPKVKIETKNSTLKKFPSNSKSQKKSSSKTKSQDDVIKQITKTEIKTSPLKDRQETAAIPKKTEKTNHDSTKEEHSVSNRDNTRNRVRGRDIQSSQSRESKTDSLNLDTNMDAVSQRLPRNRGLRDFDPRVPRYSQDEYVPKPDLDEEMPSRGRYGPRRGRFSDRFKHQSHGIESQSRRGRMFDRHSGTVTGSTAYNKREFRGPDSTLLKEANAYIGEVTDTLEKVENSRVVALDEPIMGASDSYQTITLDEYRKIEENQKIVGTPFETSEDTSRTRESSSPQDPRDNSTYYRGRYRRGYGGRRRGGNQKSRYENQYRLHHPEPSSPTSSQHRTNREEVKLDLEKDFPALKI